MRYQINFTQLVTGDKYLWKSEASKNGYHGTLVDTEYEDGVDQTTWGVYTGSEDECQRIINLYNYVKDELFTEEVVVMFDSTSHDSWGRLVRYFTNFLVYPKKNTGLKSWLECASNLHFDGVRPIRVVFTVEESDGTKPVTCKWGAPVMMDCRVQKEQEKPDVFIKTYNLGESCVRVPEYFLKK